MEIQEMELIFHKDFDKLVHMKKEDFNCPHKEIHQPFPFRDAAYLATRFEQEYCVSLYQVDGFYVESYDPLSSKGVAFIKTFTAEHLPQTYINTIDISGAFQP